MLGQCHDNQETKTCFDIVETTSKSRQKLSSYGLEHEKKIFSLVDPLNTDYNIISMFLKRKTILKPEKSSLTYTNQGKTTILPKANNGIQLVYSIVCNFNGIVLFNYSNICVNFKVDYLEECLTHFQKFS